MSRGELRRGGRELALSGAEVIAPTFAVSYDRGEQIIAKLQPSRNCPTSGTPSPPFLSSYSPTFLPTASLSRIATLFRPQLQTHNTVDHKSYKGLIKLKLYVNYIVIK